MADLIPQVPVKITDNVNTVAITGLNALKVDNSAVTQPVSGTVTANQGVPAATSDAWPITITNTSDVMVKPGDAQNNAIRVNVVAGMGGGGGTSSADKGLFTEGTSAFTPVGGVFNDDILADLTEDQQACARITAKRGLHVNLRDAAGTELGTDVAPVRVDPTGATTQPVSGTVTANAGSGTFNVSGSVQSSQGTPAAGSGAWPVTLTDTADQVVKAGDSANNAIRVNVVAGGNSETSQGMVHYHNTSSSVASGSFGTITYTTSTGVVFYLKQIIASASAGPCKVRVEFGPGPTPVAVVFFSTAQPYVSLTFEQPIEIPASTVVNVIIRNDAGSSQDLYATIIGREV